MSTSLDILNDIISGIDPVEVPVEYIVMAQITDLQGVERFVKGDEFRRMMPNPELYQIAEARVILNVRKIKKAIVKEVNAIYDEVNRRFNAAYLTGPDEEES